MLINVVGWICWCLIFVLMMLLMNIIICLLECLLSEMIVGDVDLVVFLLFVGLNGGFIVWDELFFILLFVNWLLVLLLLNLFCFIMWGEGLMGDLELFCLVIEWLDFFWFCCNINVMVEVRMIIEVVLYVI